MVRRLLEKGFRVVVLDNFSTGRREFMPKSVPFIRGDLKNFSRISVALKKHRVDAVMHFAASSLVGESVEKPLLYYENNVAACIQLLKAMLEAKVTKLIFSSTC